MSLRFRYRAATAEGEVVDGVVDAPSRRRLMDDLHHRRLFPVSIEEVAPVAVRPSMSRLSRQAAVTLWARNLATLVGAAVPLDRALAVSAEQTPHPGVAGAVHAVRRAVREGSGLAEALERHPGYFPRMAVAMIAAGEASGALDTVLEQLAEYLEETAELRSEIRSALTYPALMAVVASLGIVVLLGFVVPRFSAMLEDVGGTLPFTTRLLVWSGDILTGGWWLWLLILGTVVYALYAIATRPALRRVWHARRLSWPVIGALEMTYTTSRFTRTLGMLLGSGAAPLPALTIARAAVTNDALGERFDHAVVRIGEGAGIAASLSDGLSGVATHMLAAGEESGRLEEMCHRIAAAHDAELRRRLRWAVSLIEPVMILVFGVLVGLVALAMLQAIYSINTNIF